MTAPGIIIPLTPADIAAIHAFDEAVAVSLEAKPLGMAEMIDRLFASAYGLSASARAAKVAFGSPYDAGLLRTYIAEQKAARFFQSYPDEVAAILRPSAPKRARRG